MFNFDPNLNPKRIVLVGAGGTGTHLAMMIGRILYDRNQRNQSVPNFIIIDPDHVEAKNVGRQLFTVADIGQSKAAIVSRRVNFMFGLSSTYHITPLQEVDFNDSSYRTHADTIVMGAVDNHEARQAIFDMNHIIWIDAGNDFDTAQVVIGNTDNWHQVIRQSTDENSLAILPVAPLLFPELLEPEPEAPTVSCADLTAQGDQHLLVNQTVSSVAANYLYKLLHRQPVNSYATFLDLGSGAVAPRMITPDTLQAWKETHA